MIIAKFAGGSFLKLTTLDMEQVITTEAGPGFAKNAFRNLFNMRLQNNTEIFELCIVPATADSTKIAYRKVSVFTTQATLNTKTNRIF